MNSRKITSFFLGIILIISFVNASEPILRILKYNQESSTCKQESDLFREYLASTTENANDLYDNCNCYAENKDFAGARDCYMKVNDHCDAILKTDPSDRKALDIKTNTTDRINELDGDVYKAPPGTNCTCVKNSNYDTIIAGYNNITRLDPNDIEAWNNRGALLGELCCIEEANASFDEAISINSSLAEPWYNKGVCLFQANPQEALRCFDRSVELDPGLAEAWFNRYPLLIPSDINMSSTTNRLAYKEAVASYSKAIELNPDLGLYKPPYLIYRRMG